jgi:GTPase SAR1 family protein
MEIDEGIAALKQIIEAYGRLKLQDANEAETRRKVIDAVLEHALGWDYERDINYEVRISEDKQTEFADYILRTATTAIVVEAKKIGQDFELPFDRTSSKLGGVLNEGSVGEAIKQVRDYARKSAHPFAVATNGGAWIVFPAIRTDGISFEETQARIFRSLEDIKDRFVEFWELLSRQRVIEGGLENELFGRSKSFPTRRLISILKEPGFRLGRNRIYEHIEPAVSIALTDEALLDDVNGLKACYVISTERMKYDSRLQMYLSDIKPPLGRKVIRIRKGKSVKHIDKALENSSPSRQQFLLLLGPVGAGKTTFLHYTRKVSAANLIEKKVIWLYVDFKRASQSDSPKDFLFKELLKLLDEDKEFNLSSWDKTIQPAYEELIETLRQGTLKPIYDYKRHVFLQRISELIQDDRRQIFPYVEKILAYASKKWPTFLVVDNVDQLENEELQNKIFVEAQSIARLMRLNVIMSLRDATYLKHRESPVFDAFQVDAVYIDPPQIKPVLSRRFIYARKAIEGKRVDIVTDDGKRYQVQNLGVFFEIVAGSLLDKESGFMIEILSAGDVRRGLRLVREFLASGHASADKALHNYLTNGSYHFPIHEVFKGAILGQKKYYREEESALLNIYDAKLGLPLLPLLRLRIVYYLIKKASDATFEGIKFKEISDELYQIGVAHKDAEKVVQDLLYAKAIQTYNGLPLSQDSVLIPTRLGGYFVHDLSRRLMYLEPCILDSIIYDDDAWEKLQDLTQQIEHSVKMDRIDLRMARVECFLQYLLQKDQEWVVKCKRYNLSELWHSEMVKELKPSIESEIEKVKTSAQKWL